MALKKEHMEILKEILSFLFSNNPMKHIEIFKNYSVDVIIDGTDEEKMVYIKKYLQEVKVPKLELEENGRRSSITEAEEATLSAKSILEAIK